MLSIVKTTALGAVMGATVGISRKYLGHMFKGSQPTSNEYSEYSALCCNKEYTDHMDELKKFKMYSDKDFETILRCVDRFLSIPDAIIVRKQFGLIRTAQRYVNKIESCLRSMRSNINAADVKVKFSKVMDELVNALNGEVINMQRDLKSMM